MIDYPNPYRQPSSVRYGGAAWLPEQGDLINGDREYGFEVDLPARVYPVVDLVADNYGTGVVVWTGSCYAVIDAEDLDPGPEIELPDDYDY